MHARGGPRVTIEILGCKLNQTDSEALARQFALYGYKMVRPGDVADVFVVNTCTVTTEADRQARQSLHRRRR